MLLPRGYARSARRYPVLYLLHGAVDDYRSWTTKGDAEALTAGLPLIVVMPDAGPGGWYTDWLRGRAADRWETFHLDQLIPWIDRTLPDPPDRDGRAVAGPVDGRVRRDELRGAPARHVRRGGELLRRGGLRQPG